MKKLLLITIALIVSLTQIFGQQISRAEYFFNTDPGFGNGISISISAGDTIDLQSNIQVPNNLSGGLHRLFIRAANQNNVWSFPESYFIFIAASAEIPEWIEYSIGNTTTYQSITTLSQTIGDTVAFSAIIPTPQNITTGIQFLRIVTGNSKGLKSVPEYYVFTSGFTSNRVELAEYFIDTDPGFGQGIPLVFAAGGDTSQQIVQINIPQSLNTGQHSIFCRVKDSSGNWSVPERTSFTICTNYGPISNFDYNINAKQVLFTNRSDSATSYLWRFGDGTTSNQINPSKQYAVAGFYTVTLFSTNICGTDSLKKIIPVRGIQSVSPSVVANVGAMSLSIQGVSLDTSARIFIRKGNSTYPINKLTVKDSTTLMAWAYNNHLATGWYDVIGVVKGRSDTLFNALKVDAPNDTLLRVKVEAYPEMLVNRAYPVRVRVINESNRFLTGVPVYIEVKDTNTNIISHNLVDTVGVNQSILALSRNKSSFYPFTDSVTNQKLLGAYLIIPYIRPNSNVYLEFEVQCPVPIYIPIRAMLGNPLYELSSFMLMDSLSRVQSCGNLPVPPCLSCLLDIASAVPGCIGGIAGLAQIPCKIGDAIESAGGGGAGGAASAIWGVTDVALDIVDAGIQCSPAGVGASIAAKTFDALKESADNISDALDQQDGNQFGDCGSCYKQFDTIAPLFRSSWDPNFKSGPNGITSGKFITDSTIIDYTIYFENLPSATAPASEVWIKDTLNPAVFDFTSFRFTHFGFDSTYVLIDQPDSTFSKDIDLRPSKNTIVRINGTFSSLTGIAEISMRSFDPLTMNLTPIVANGFLAPNTTPPVGEGFVSFTINAKRNLTSGDSITNQATIIFDSNPPIYTNMWINKIDETTPQSQISSFTKQTDSLYTLHISGTDLHAGIKHYGIYGALIDSAYTLMAIIDVDTINVRVDPGKTYKFYSRAVDYMLNKEAAPTTPDILLAIPLPVKWISFNAVRNDKHVLLSWVVTAESNVHRYIVEHSVDGVNFIPIAQLPVINRTGYNTYQFNHTKPIDGENYYRIKLLNIDNSFEFTPLRKINFKDANRYLLFPNPTGDIVTIEGTVASDIVSIIQPDGKVVLSNTAKEYITAITVSFLKQGLYYIKIVHQNKTVTLLKFIKS